MKTTGRTGRALVGAALVAVAGGACIRPPLIEEPPESPLARRTRILAADGTVLATLFIENREPVFYEEIPKSLIDAVVAAEDQRFWTHRGFDARAIVRAALQNAAANQAVQGGSTITQQYVKNVYFPIRRPKTLQQKVREAELAWKLEEQYSKKEILRRYLNTIYFGDGAYGVKVAAERFFRKPVSLLTLSESALLAGIIRSPENDNPRRFPERALERRSYVIARMEKLGMITAADAEQAQAAPLTLAEPPRQEVLEPYFVEYVKRTILDDPLFGRDEAERADFLFRSGADIKTTLDPRLQAIARDSVTEILNRPGEPEAALVSLDPKTGQVLAMIGGRDFSSSQVNLATGSMGGGSGRQAGSAFKPFVLAAAIEKGILPNTIYPSDPPTIRLGPNQVWRPKNYDGQGHGPMTVETATILSVNAVYARLGMDVGPPRVMGTAQRLGIRAPLRPVASISLGTNEVSVLEMASAYGTLANYGLYVAPTPIVQVSTPDGDPITPYQKTHRAVGAGTAWLVTDALTKVITQGTGRRALLDRPAAGKTGTTEDVADAWFVGYTPELVTAVWVGYPTGRFSMRNVRGVTVFGGTFPAMIWRRFMLRALEGRPALAFDLPTSDLITVDIDPGTGLLAGPNCAGRQTAVMLRQLAPSSTCAPIPTTSPSPAVSDSPSPTPSPTPSPEPSPTSSPEPSPTTSP